METFFGERYFFDKFHGMVNRIALTHVLTLTPNAQINRHQIIRMVLISSVCMPLSRLPFLASQPIWIQTHQNSNKRTKIQTNGMPLGISSVGTHSTRSLSHLFELAM